MFSYYGSKGKIIQYYPPPKHDLIIEPFAGSARYALKYWERDVLIIDRSQVICNIWNYLKVASAIDIRKIKPLSHGDRILRDNYSCEGEYNLVQFIAHQGTYWPANIVSKFGGLRFESNKRNIIANITKVKHWKVKCMDYQELRNKKATWFIDPPYTHGGHKYPFGSTKIDYTSLAKWCMERHGQVIVCENIKGKWLPFHPLVQITGINRTKSMEAIWTNQPIESTKYKAQKLF